MRRGGGGGGGGGEEVGVEECVRKVSKRGEDDDEGEAMCGLEGKSWRWKDEANERIEG